MANAPGTGSLAIQKLVTIADEPEKAAYRLAGVEQQPGCCSSRQRRCRNGSDCDNRDALDGNQWGSSTCRGFFGIAWSR